MADIPKIAIAREYWTLKEVHARWKLPDDSLDIHRAVLKGILLPVLFLDTLLLPVTKADDGAVVTLHDAETVRAAGFYYLQFMRQIDAFDCEVQAVSHTKEVMQGDVLLALPEPLRMAGIFARSIVLLDDLVQAERDLVASGQQALTDREHDSALKLIAVLASDGYGFDPRQRSDTVERIVEASQECGLAMSENNVRKYLRRAYDHHKPARLVDQLPAKQITLAQ